MENQFVFDVAYLNRKRAQIKNEIVAAKYKIGNTWYDAMIQSASVLNDGRIEVKFIISPNVSGTAIVSAIELYDLNGVRVGSRAVSIDCSELTEGVFYAISFSLFQIVENESGTGAYDSL